MGSCVWRGIHHTHVEGLSTLHSHARAIGLAPTIAIDSSLVWQVPPARPWWARPDHVQSPMQSTVADLIYQ